MKRTALTTGIALLAAAAPGQPQGRVLWSAEGNDGVYSCVTLPDVDDDSLPDVAVSIYYSAYPPDPRKSYCYSGTNGDTVWVNRNAYGSWGNKGLDVSADLNDDGYADVLLGTVGTYLTPGRSVIAISGRSGDTLWTYSRGQDWGWVYSVRSFIDIDGDTVPDVLGAAGTNPPANGAAVLVSGRTGDEIWFFRLPSDAGECIAPFVDVDADAVPDVLFGAGGNSINDTAYCLSGATGVPLWRCNTLGSVSDIERIADVNSSGTDDCVGGGWSDSVFCLEGGTGAFIWGTDVGSVVMEVVPARDMSGDGIPDVVVGSWGSNVRVLSGADGATLWTGAVGADVWSVDTLADVTGDGRPEVVAGCLGNGNGTVRLFSGTDGSVRWSHDFAERVYDVTGAPDLNGDGRPDVLVGLQDQDHQTDHIYCFDGLPPSAVAAAEPARRVLPATYDPAANAVRFTAGPDTRYCLSVFDLNGCRAFAPVRGAGTARPTVVPVPALPAGVYYGCLTTSDGRAGTVRLAVLPGRDANPQK